MVDIFRRIGHLFNPPRPTSQEIVLYTSNRPRFYRLAKNNVTCSCGGDFSEAEKKICDAEMNEYDRMNCYDETYCSHRTKSQGNICRLLITDPKYKTDLYNRGYKYHSSPDMVCKDLLQTKPFQLYTNVTYKQERDKEDMCIASDFTDFKGKYTCIEKIPIHKDVCYFS